MEELKKNYHTYFESDANHEYTVYGVAELAGNHSDRQCGQILATTIDLSIKAVAEANGTDTINICSEGFGLISLKLDKNHPLTKEKGTPAAIVRGVASRYPKASGFNAYMTSQIIAGKGHASSAAFGVIIARIIEDLFDCRTDNTTLAQNVHYAESAYFGKVAGLMNPMVCAYGGIVKINFNSVRPVVETIEYDFEKNGYTLCFIDSGTDLSSFADRRAEIGTELLKVSNYFFRDSLSQVDKKQFAMQLAELRKYAGDRAVLRAMHIMNENYRVNEMASLLKSQKIDAYLDQVNESGNSSWMLMQNVIPSGQVVHQDLAFAINTVRFFLAGKGACRVMGGGFGGRLLAYVPTKDYQKFAINIERTLGKGSLSEAKISSY